MDQIECSQWKELDESGPETEVEMSSVSFRENEIIRAYAILFKLYNQGRAIPIMYWTIR
jgi:hypothetical protein